MEWALLKTATGLAVGIFLLSAVLFFIIPRYRSGYLTALSSQAQNITGFSETVTLGDIRKILRSPAVVMRVTVEGDPRQFQSVKWRGLGLNSFDGAHWFNDNTEQRPIVPASVEHFLVPQLEGWQMRARRQLRYHILRSALSTDVLFAAPTPRWFPAGFAWSLSTKQAPCTILNLLSCRSLMMWYRSPDSPPRRSCGAVRRNVPDDVRLVYLRVPDLDPRIARLARQITSAATNNYDRAAALQDYLRANFSYSLDPSGIEPKDPIGSFLFKSKSGYCEYFAAAMALMLRTLDIPSRLVNGFQTGSYNPIGKDFVVRARDAHSWVEVYFPRYGWIAFDPTPADPNPIQAGAWEDYLDALNLFWSEWIINYDFSHQIRLARQVEQSSRDVQQDFRRRTDELKRRGAWLALRLEAWLVSHMFLMLLFMAVVMAALLAADKRLGLAEMRFLWDWRFRRQGVAATPFEATLSYQRLLKTLAKKGYSRPASATPWEFAQSLASTRIGPERLRIHPALQSAPLWTGPGPPRAPAAVAGRD